MRRSGSSSLRRKRQSPSSRDPGILRAKSPTRASPTDPLRHRDYSPPRPPHSPLRQKSGSRSPQHRSEADNAYPRFSRYEHERKMDLATRTNKGQHSSNSKQSKASLKNQYYRQMNLCKKTKLNCYETSLFVGYLLDLINLSRKLETMR